jgi:hypothetical protein
MCLKYPFEKKNPMIMAIAISEGRGGGLSSDIVRRYPKLIDIVMSLLKQVYIFFF